MASGQSESDHSIQTGVKHDVNIPAVCLSVPPVIQQAVERAHNIPSISDIPAEQLNDDSFLIVLQGHVDQWAKSIQAVTKLTVCEDFPPSALQEVRFWREMERALDDIETQLRSDQVRLVMECFRTARRFNFQVAFLADTGLKDAKDVVARYNSFLTGLPLDALLSATSLEKVQEGIVLVFCHISRSPRLSPYPFRRTLRLTEAISRDVAHQLLQILTAYPLLDASYEGFERLLAQADAVFRTWDVHMREFTNVAREVMRKSKPQERLVPIEVDLAHKKLEDRVHQLDGWRKQHEQLVATINELDNVAEEDAETMRLKADAKEAYEVMKLIDVLDVSTEGGEAWLLAQEAYKNRVARARDKFPLA